jgi:hypothetical protein
LAWMAKEDLKINPAAVEYSHGFIDTPGKVQGYLQNTQYFTG